jgi:flagellum-specific peptidoglycan hydrolase FlgJ
MLRLLTLLLVVWVVLSSCHAHRHHRHLAEEKRQQQARRYSTEEYIATYKGIAVSNMRRYGIPACIILAQGILESSNGNSDLARYANNHFGIKCTSEWTGKTYFHDDDKKNECFRYYPNAEVSYQDHAAFLKRPRYASLFNLHKNDYKGWAYGLKKAGYATNPQYPQLLISLIEKYNLEQYK